MSFMSDLGILYHMAFAKAKGASHADRLEAFYRSQAGAYDDFRRRLLHGRPRLIKALPALPAGARVVDMGGGTGSNFEYLADRIPGFESVTLVDLTPSLVKVADERIKKHGWTNVRTVVADATTFVPDTGPVDLVMFSYSLTMIPDWMRCIEQAHRILKPNGLIGVTDFYISRKWPADGMRKHGAAQRLLWPGWFSNDNVFLSPDHVPYLQMRFKSLHLEEAMGRVPYLLGLKAPYYVFIGQKTA